MANIPIRTVTPASVNGTAIGPAVDFSTLPAPTKSDWAKQDLSAPDAGRVESGRMVKKRRGKVDKLELEWQFISRADIKQILQVFDSEYCLVEYLDARAGDWVTKHFYTGDMQTTGWLPDLECWQSVAFNIIQATPDTR